MIITLDGPAGSGKSTLAKALAAKLGIEYIDSGALYRSLTFYGLQRYGSLKDHETQIAEFFRLHPEALNIQFEQHHQKVRLNDQELTTQLRDPYLTTQILYIASNPDCRKVVNQMIRNLAHEYSVVIDGRDIGSVVFPESKNKFYLDAATKTRALRRASEQGTATSGPEFEQLVQQITDRDHSDMNRSIAPLQIPTDAVCINTNDLSIEQVLEIICSQLTFETP